MTYNSNSQLENETIPHIVNLSIQYGYDAYGRQTLRQLKQNDMVHASVSLSYDSRGRTATVGNGADVLHYAYRAGRNQLETAEWKNAQNAVLNSRSYAYDSYHRLTGINLNGTLEVGYTLNDKDRRTGAEYANSGLWNFTYDDKGQVISALGSSRSFAYTYDGIGNRTAATEGGEQFSYASNQLNQYTAVNASQPTYDADGNLLTTGTGWTYTWNGENRLIAAENGDTRLEFNYDCMGRRFEKKVYTANTLTKHEKFVYDGYKLTAVYDVLENNALRMTFAWQPDSVDLDVPVSMTCDGETYYYVTDGNKNVTALLDADGVRVAKYTYNPFGRILNSEGALAEINPFRFSSEYHDDETGLVYYNYRYYSPELGRWISRDPIEEEGGVNLYAMVGNNPVNYWDSLGFLPMPNIFDLDAMLALRNAELASLRQWRIDKTSELEIRFKGLCPEKCCVNRRKQKILKQECEIVAGKISKKIIQDVGDLIENYIKHHWKWPEPGLKGNLYANVTNYGMKCNTWADTVEGAATATNTTEDGKVVFFIANLLSQSILRHTWTEVFGPCRQDNPIATDPKDSSPQTRGDFSIDFWQSGGRSIKYDMMTTVAVGIATVGRW